MRAGALLLAAGLAGLGALSAPRALALDLERPEVREFVDEVAARNQLPRAWVARVIGAAETKPAIIEAISRPAERVKPWFEYRAIFLTDKRVRDGREFYALHRALLEDVAQRTGVPGELIAAIVGIETFYGRLTGRYRVLDALATLAFDYPPRAAYFRGELEQLLLLSREAGVDVLTAMGSYAGAMGAPQFMPRSYRTFARDGDRDGRIDLWNDWPDIVESVAHYFVASGWRHGEPIVADATLLDPDVEGLPANRLDLGDSVGSLRARGVEFDSPLPEGAPALFVALREADAPSYRVGFHNFWVITRYNRSAMYALAAAELAAAIAAAPPDSPAPAPPAREPPPPMPPAAAAPATAVLR
ncbi:MAG TPA: lytic murein transglycosylase B [Steroidobacteraceae bacterium]|nr:lytic murein transglycosylase B [Steroidobacteraceae bacterium]